MKPYVGPVLIAAACLGMSACHFPWSGKPAAPTGQVVATVGGQEITVRDLRAELAGANINDPRQEKQAEQAALQRIIGRTLLAQGAREMGIDKTPDFVLQQQRAVDGLLVEALESKTAAAVPAPTRDEAQNYVISHPDQFAERKIFSVDQIRLGRPEDPTVLPAMKPLNTLEDIQALLDSHHVKYQRGQASLDAAGADPRLVEQILKLPPHEVFVMPSGNFILVNLITGVRVDPLTGDPAVDLALKVLKQQHTQEAVQRQLNAILAKGAKTVAINKAYQPAPPAGGKAPAAAPAGADAGKAS